MNSWLTSSDTLYRKNTLRNWRSSFCRFNPPEKISRMKRIIWRSLDRLVTVKK